MKIYIAQSIEDSLVPELHLNGTEPFPSFKDTKEHEDMLCIQGRYITSKLVESLPGGVVNTILIYLLEIQKSQLTVPYKNFGALK